MTVLMTTMPPYRPQHPLEGPAPKGEGAQVKKLEAAANAKASRKAAPVAAALTTRSQAKVGQWHLVPSSEATFERLSVEPNTTILLSADEAAWRDSVERAATDDPAAYLERCRSEGV